MFKKLLILIIVLAAAWFGWKYWSEKRLASELTADEQTILRDTGFDDTAINDLDKEFQQIDADLNSL